MVVVLGGTHHNTLSIIRCLGERGIVVDLILCETSGNNSYVLKSKFIHDYTIASDAVEAVNILQKRYAGMPYIVCSDDVAALLNHDYEHYMNKQRQVELAKEVGFNVPISFDHKVGQLLPPLKYYPCLVKPLSSCLGGKRIDICNNEQQLRVVISQYDLNAVIQIQEYLNKDYEIVVDGVAVNGQIIIPGFVKKHRDVKGGTSFCTVYSSNNLPNDLLRKINNMVNAINYEGLFGVEFIVSKGRYFFIEINLRNDATTYAISVAGVNLPYIYVQAKVHEDYSNEIKRQVRTINAIVERRDLTFVFNRQISLMKWIKDFKRSECRYFYNPCDIKPFISIFVYYLGAPFRRIKRLL